MYDYVIIHGSYGCPFENWFSWLYGKLTEKGKNVLVPQMPCGENIQNLENWTRVMDSYKHLIDENTDFIGHSLSPAFIADYLIANGLKAKNLYFAAPFYGLIDIPDFDKVNSPFFVRKDLNKLASLTKKRFCFISKTDPYVPNELSDRFAADIQAEKIYVDNAGHFNTSAGYTSFEQLLSYIENND